MQRPSSISGGLIAIATAIFASQRFEEAGERLSEGFHDTIEGIYVTPYKQRIFIDFIMGGIDARDKTIHMWQDVTILTYLPMGDRMWIDIAPSMDEKGWSQRNLAAALGKEPTVVSRFFKPNFDPKVSLLLEIANALDVDVRDLFNPGLDGSMKTMPKSKKTLATLEKLGLIDPPKKKITKKIKKK